MSAFSGIDPTKWSINDLFGGNLPDLTKWSINDLFGTGKTPTMFGLTPQDPTGALQQSLGYDRGSVDYSGQRAGTAEQLRRLGYGNFSNTALNGDILNLPMFQDFINQENYLNPIRGNLQKLTGSNGFMDSLKSMVQKGLDPKLLQDLQNSTKTQSGIELRDALRGVRGSFDPSLSPGVLSGQEFNTRQQFGSNLSSLLSNQAINFEKLKQTWTGLGTGLSGVDLGVNQLLAGLAPSQLGTSLLNMNTNITQGQLGNQRFEEMAGKADLQNLMNTILQQVQQGVNTAMSLPSILFPGRYSGGGGGGGSNSALGWAGLGLTGANSLVNAGGGLLDWQSFLG